MICIARACARGNGSVSAGAPRITDVVYGVPAAEGGGKSRTSQGGTAPANVRREAKKWLKRLAKEPSSRATTADGGVAPDA